MENYRHVQVLLDRVESVEVELRNALILAVSRAYRYSEIVHAGLGYEFLSLFGVGVHRVFLVDLDVVLYAAESAELRLYRHAYVVSRLHYLGRERYVIL